MPTEIQRQVLFEGELEHRLGVPMATAVIAVINFVARVSREMNKAVGRRHRSKGAQMRHRNPRVTSE